MIKDPPVLTIRRAFERPAPEQVKALGDVPTGYLVDAMGGRGALEPPIGPVDLASPLPTKFCGPALTSHCGPADNLALLASLSFAQAGDVLITATDAFGATAVTGDLLLGMARNIGVVGFVTDGRIRDLDGCIGVGLPVHCAGVTANSPARTGPGTIGMPIQIGGVKVESGDIVAGDRDGVVIVPRARIAAVIDALAGVREAEAGLEKRVAAGLRQMDPIAAMLETSAVRFVD